jgi:hypothetical protein
MSPSLGNSGVAGVAHIAEHWGGLAGDILVGMCHRGLGLSTDDALFETHESRNTGKFRNFLPMLMDHVEFVEVEKSAKDVVPTSPPRIRNRNI